MCALVGWRQGGHVLVHGVLESDLLELALCVHVFMCHALCVDVVLWLPLPVGLSVGLSDAS